jgi:uncharacterized membrane protein YsdA (DUF1294 family)
MSEERQHGSIIEWRSKCSFGFAEVEGERVFLHIANFAERARWPEAGDPVSFRPGHDDKGRPCAQDIVLHASGSVFGWRHGFELALLLALPSFALSVLIEFISVWWVLFCVSVTSSLAVLLQWLDKRFSVSKHSRIPETTLHLFELCGGWPGSFVGQRILRHKISKGPYQLVFWAIVLIHQLFALDLIFGGLLYNGLHQLDDQLPVEAAMAWPSATPPSLGGTR